MKKIIACLCFVAIMATGMAQKQVNTTYGKQKHILVNADSFDGVRQLIERRAPWLSKHVEFKAISTDLEDCFTLKTIGRKLVIGASGPNAAAVGVKWYLKYYCHRSISHMGDMLAPVKKLPKIEDELKISTSAACRYALNYCTYNYTMSFYSWDEWQWELDWMALNGVNLMLVANGAEAVWQNTLRRLNYSEKEIADFIPGPAYNAWWLMGNLEGWGGPMPQSQIDSRTEMVQQMLKRMKELGIEPLMPGFYGMVPSTLKNKSQARIIPQGGWWAFTRPDILDPSDPEFERIAGIFYEETKRLYGANIRFFSGDPFHEGGTANGISLGDAGQLVQKAMQKHFPKSVWVLQGWQGNPSSKLLEKLDKRYVLVQELFGENTNDWEQRAGYEGTPFIWGTVTNFGERPGISGKLQRFADEVHRATEAYPSHMKGVGILPEGINNNPVAYEFLLETVWHKERIDAAQWIEGYIKARYGRITDDISSAWQLLLKTAYSSTLGHQEGGSPENVLCARPGLKLKFVSSWGQLAKMYDPNQFREAAILFAKALPEFGDVSTYRLDLINLLRQVIANDADSVYANLVAAYDSRNKAQFEREATAFLTLIDLENELLAQDPFFRLSTWQQQAHNSGNTEYEKKNNVRNLMILITYWGGSKPSMLRDYAYKEWAGLMTAFYKERWMIYFEHLRQLLDGENNPAPDFHRWECEWVENNYKIIDDSPRISIEDIVNKIARQTRINK